MKQYINEIGKICYDGATENTPYDPQLFLELDWESNDRSFYLHTNLGSLTVVDRMTGFGYRDIESGYRDPSGNFWLASGQMDIREQNKRTLGEAIEWVKAMANTCVPSEVEA